MHCGLPYTKAYIKNHMEECHQERTCSAVDFAASWIKFNRKNKEEKSDYLKQI